MENLNIPAQLNSELNANPNNNYRIFSKAVNFAKEKHLLIIAKFKHNIKRTWSIINESLHRKKKISRIFYYNGKTLEDPSEIANAFNEYFISIGPSLANKIDKNNNF